MLPVILLSLITGCLALCLIAVLFFLRAGYWGERDMARQAKVALTWRPPFMRGGMLRNWAATTAEQLVQNRLTGTPSRKTLVQLATEVEEGAVQAMLPLARRAELERVVACPETGQGTVGVTALEVLAIAAYLRKNCSRAERKRIHDLAAENSRKIAARVRGDTKLPPLPCPLQRRDHVCCAYAVRPVCCRPLHAISIALGMGSRSVTLAGSPADATNGDRHEQTIAQGIEIGLTRALKSAGLDANVYELNSALAIALQTANAAERWANGESVFAPCHATGVGITSASVSRTPTITG